MKATDIRAELPVATKGGTSHKPEWSINGQSYRFVASANAKGQAANGKKIRLGNRIFAQYKAGVTTSGKDLMFVGVFSEVKS
jgi:hypothetical protein